ncbi:hypothetical protein [Candidatus Ichthyocystis sparus]|uniref:hypothetical protein n=1 Tax=Candidatus Ichthyocystis sparus TaxID=1561004 RepID=UPI000B8A0143|nr:hypothetical protein [Candidatus Ichthyocystis sparus]
MGPIDSNGSVHGVFPSEVSKSQEDSGKSTQRLSSGSSDSPAKASRSVPRCGITIINKMRGNAGSNFSTGGAFPSEVSKSQEDSGESTQRLSSGSSDSSARADRSVPRCGITVINTVRGNADSNFSPRIESVSSDYVDIVEGIDDEEKYFVRNDTTRRAIRSKRLGYRGLKIIMVGAPDYDGSSRLEGGILRRPEDKFLKAEIKSRVRFMEGANDKSISDHENG